ncbi:zinc finger BED domain-containing protein DAYSLEEPER-like [Impatiens glandulifera]|uniref:zinc finger BED domain-containing protein DAYSLEEPER-like n=1 Tax=Impatiens glandulifera TaxID=253017 RepID=UPI001FB11586|nr:zinc finger BED domain-containing protein DAYSLEEPER-like [Impatiens glandulifera]XP_047308917.1 zinc finger BED domain-containing protein DAYSLEEPER-like [Impatiens glandulifera]
MDTLPTENNALAVIEETAQPATKRRKKMSLVWEHFTIETISPECRRACCKRCKQTFAYSTGSKVSGTSHLKRHIAKGTCPLILKSQRQNQNESTSSLLIAPSNTDGIIQAPKRKYRTGNPSNLSNYVGFDSDRSRHEITRMIIMNDYPLHIVEHPGFVSFVKSLQPEFNLMSFNTVHGDCVATYLREKESLQRIVEGIPGRICLTIDTWTSAFSKGYVFLTGHFIDSEWKLHRKVLNVVLEHCLDSDLAFSHAVAACLSDWNMEGRLFSLSINHPLSVVGIDNLRALLSLRNPLILCGQLLVDNCLARALTHIALGAFRAGEATVRKVRDSVKYVKTSEPNEEIFNQLKQQLQVPSLKTLVIDDLSRWNTTYEMLVSASELREVFSCLDTVDPNYKLAPTMDDWKQVEVMCTYLKLLFDTANVLTNPALQTTNTFFHEAWKIQLELARAVTIEDPFVRYLTRPMQEAFDAYWKNCCLMLAIAVVMDPRFKMKLVEFSFKRIYGHDSVNYVKVVDEGLHELFIEYVALPPPLPLPLAPIYAEEEVNGEIFKQEESPNVGMVEDHTLALSDFDVFIIETTSQQERSELDQYLEESLLPRVHDFDVLGWWKINKMKYPTLSKMARDILTIPVCTVGPNSVFDTVMKEMDNYRCSLQPETVEALVCAKDWLKGEPKENSTAPVRMEFPI